MKKMKPTIQLIFTCPTEIEVRKWIPHKMKGSSISLSLFENTHFSKNGILLEKARKKHTSKNRKQIPQNNFVWFLFFIYRNF
jgi:hypothetical protein